MTIVSRLAKTKIMATNSGIAIVTNNLSSWDSCFKGGCSWLILAVNNQVMPADNTVDKTTNNGKYIKLPNKNFNNQKNYKV